jgi:hypothetical protein
MTQFRVELRERDWLRLVDLAGQERRTPPQQAAYLLERALRRATRRDAEPAGRVSDRPRSGASHVA